MTGRLIPDTPGKSYICSIATMMLVPALAFADGIVVEKVYDPYVQPLETELEFRLLLLRDDQLPNTRKTFLGFGRSLGERWFVEVYAIGIEEPGQNLSVDTYEIEAKWQISEQGEYAFDWGMLFEVEREIEKNVWEFSASLLSSRDFGRWTATANFGVILEQGEGTEDEIETALHMQSRYRYKESFEPAIELHMGQDTIALGPAATGLIRLSKGRKVRWELGIFAGLDSLSPDQTVKANVEFEF